MFFIPGWTLESPGKTFFFFFLIPTPRPIPDHWSQNLQAWGLDKDINIFKSFCRAILDSQVWEWVSQTKALVCYNYYAMHVDKCSSPLWELTGAIWWDFGVISSSSRNNVKDHGVAGWDGESWENVWSHLQSKPPALTSLAFVGGGG